YRYPHSYKKSNIFNLRINHDLNYKQIGSFMLLYTKSTLLAMISGSLSANINQINSSIDCVG
ncbi:hypothetical protein, partial [Acinetobacter baumannii]